MARGTGYDTLKFLFKDENLNLLKEFYFDTFTYPARTFMLKNDEILDELFTIESDESNRQPRMRVWYKGGWSERGVLLNLTLGQGDILITPVQALRFINHIASRGDTAQLKLNLSKELSY